MILLKRVFILSVVLFLLSSNIRAYGIGVSAKSAVVIDASSKRVLYEKDAYTKRGMASTTKIMTGLLAVENLDFNEVVTVSPFAASTEGSSIWLAPGEHITVGDLVYGLMLASGNDAATALSEYMAGGVEAFTFLMNNRAKEIGALNTNFTNPHGLPDENHYTTAYDLALISACAMENNVFSDIVKTQSKQISWEGSEWNRSLSNHNKLLKMYKYSTGIKTGYTKKDGRCLVSCSEKDNQKLIIVTLSAPDDWNDHINLSEYCFSKYSSCNICEKGENVGVLVSKSNEYDDIRLFFGSDYYASFAENELSDITKKLTFNPVFPVKKGDRVGVCYIYYKNNQIGRVNLVSGNDASLRKNLIEIIKQLMKGIIRQ